MSRVLSQNDVRLIDDLTAKESLNGFDIANRLNLNLTHVMYYLNNEWTPARFRKQEATA